MAGSMGLRLLRSEGGAKPMKTISDAEGRVVSIELLDAHTQLAPQALAAIKVA
jgi:hypothetical protein